MRRFLKSLVAVILISLMTGGWSSGAAKVAAAKMGSHHSRRPARSLALRHGPFCGAATGEHAVMLRLVNHSSAACTVSGYPTVVLYDAKGHVLPFRYASGGGPYVTSKKPVTVVLAHRPRPMSLSPSTGVTLGSSGMPAGSG